MCNELLCELRHLSATGWANCTHHIATLCSLLHSSLIIGHRLLLLAFHAEHFSQSVFPPLSESVDVSGC